MLRFLAFATAAILATGSPAFPRDQESGKADLRSPAAWCCGSAMRNETTAPPVDGRMLHDLDDIAAWGDAQLGLDGANWSCQRPDGSQRCVSALP